MSSNATTMSTQTVTSPDGTRIAYQTIGGGGDGVIVVGGALRDACDYVAFGEVLARSFTVHIVDRRGRGESGPKAQTIRSTRNAKIFSLCKHTPPRGWRSGTATGG